MSREVNRIGSRVGGGCGNVSKREGAGNEYFLVGSSKRARSRAWVNNNREGEVAKIRQAVIDINNGERGPKDECLRKI